MVRVFALLALGLLLAPVAQAQVADPPALGPVQAQLQPDGTWVLQLPVQMCGGPRIGDAIYIQAVDPLAMPGAVAPGSVVVAEQPADATVQGDTLRVALPTGVAWPMVCIAGLQPVEVDLLPVFGLDATGVDTPTLQVWTGLAPTPQTVIATPGGAPTPSTSPQSGPAPAPPPATLSGVALVGPTCPVQPLNDPTGRCADRPYAALVRALRPDGSEAARALADATGAFSLGLDPGTYTIVAGAPDGSPFPRPASQVVTLAAGDAVQLTLQLDSGIR